VKTENKKKLGFTLVELLVVMVILSLLMIAAVGVLNPRSLTDRATDLARKKDLNKMRTAFEEYFNDKGKYPSFSDLNNWNVSGNCNKTVSEMSNYLNKWPCGTGNTPYTIIVNTNWFKVVTNLGNKKDKDIPEGWYDGSRTYTTNFNKNEVNYGVSSSNVLWYEGDISAACGSICLKLNASGCNDAAGVGCKSPDNCYLGTCSLVSCKVSSCE